jgi:hypothetical protein
MISEKELDEMAEGFGEGEILLQMSYKAGFTKAEKFYLAKIAELEKNNERLKNEIIELIDLGTDQVVTEKITRLESRLKSARECIEFYDNNTVIEGEFINGDFATHEATGFQVTNKRAREWIKSEGENGKV